ncbi:MAG TPA: hypothetical protein PK076_09190 [Saprospiraceae bacterium]|nr:hypothetical protein [Saprospiraceae bacterium]HQW56288.1 hypothetical protein [Saprospiraceae bacterium]
MTPLIIIALCILLLVAYIFELTNKFSRIPSILLLLFLGWLTREIASFYNFKVPDLNSMLPALGTISLLLIVLEGSMDLQLNHSKRKMIQSAFLTSFVVLVFTAIYLSFVIYMDGTVSFQKAFVNAIPFIVISSSIAIPIAKMLPSAHKEFVTYESSFSDILGILFFNFFTINEVINLHAIGSFVWQLLLIILISIFSSLVLSVFVRKISHTVKFLPIIIMIILIYLLAEEIHLPGLLFILIFGIFLENLDQFKNVKLVRFLHPESIEDEIERFKELTAEVTFVARAVFFLVFGFTLETAEIIDVHSLFLSVTMVLGILAIRGIYLNIVKLPLNPLLFMAPRGLITILLFLSIPTYSQIGFIDKSVVIQVVLLTTIVSAFGLVFKPKNTLEVPEENTTETEAPALDN